VIRASADAAINNRIAKKKMTSELAKAYFATTNPELQMRTNIAGAKRSNFSTG
jgi:hypothetical protein